MALRALALCAGLGGLELGVRAAVGGKLRCVGYVERESFPASVLVARMAEQALDQAPIWDDLSTFPGDLYRGKVDLLLAGFPCQPASVAGSRRGTSDERWLWPQIDEIIGDVEPELIFLENVPGLLSVDQGAAFGSVLASLARRGFDAEWGLLRAADVGAPHRRERCFVLAWRVPDALRAAVRLIAERGRRGARSAEPRDAQPGDVGPRAGVGDVDDRDGDVADARRARLARGERARARGKESAPVEAHGSVAELRRARVADADGRRQQERRKSERGEREGALGRVTLGHGPDGRLPWPPGPADRWGWEAWLAAGGPAPAIRRSADGISDRLVLPHRADELRALGNACVPDQAEAAFRILALRALTSLQG